MKEKKKVIFLKGLPASGKTTWAKDFVKHTPGFIRVNKDDIRKCLSFPFSKENEKITIKIRDNIIHEALSQGGGVIVDDTNIMPFHEQRVRQIADLYGAEFFINDSFLDVDKEECIARDLKRPVTGGYVGAEVIERMAKDLERYPKFPVVEQNLYLPRAVICDIDGTLADYKGIRSPYDWGKVRLDKPNNTVIDALLGFLNHGYFIIILSGRDGCCYEDTKLWLSYYGVPYTHLYMRGAGDNRRDDVVKFEIFNNKIKEKYYVSLVLDDRGQVVKMWRKIGLTVWQVAEGNF